MGALLSLRALRRVPREGLAAALTFFGRGSSSSLDLAFSSYDHRHPFDCLN